MRCEPTPPACRRSAGDRQAAATRLGGRRLTVSVGSRRDLTLDAFSRVAWGGEPVEITSPAIDRMDECHAAFLRLVDSLKARDPQALIYGVTTGPGDSGSVVLSADAERSRPTRLWTAVSFGEPLPERVVRGILLARLANLIEGNAGVRGNVALEVAGMLSGSSLPNVPAEGNGGSGEILALGHLFYELSERVRLEPKERMALINGSPAAAAMVADASLAGRRRLEIACRVFALAVEALGAPMDAYGPELESFWNDEHETEALRLIRGMLNPDADRRLPSQGPVSFRILPRVLGQALRAQAEAEAVASTSLQSITDNPVFIPPDSRHPQGAVISNGGFHNQAATSALDSLAFSWADLCQLAQRESDKLFVHPATAPELNDEWGLKPVHMVQTGWAEEARNLAQPSLLSLGSFGQNDVPAMSFFAWRKAMAIGRCLDASLAILAAVATQAIAIAGRRLTPELGAFAMEISADFPAVAGVRRLGRDFEAVARRFNQRVFSVTG